jgi:hypothetical protein
MERHQMGWETHWRGAETVSNTQDKKYSVFWPILGLKKRTGAGYETQIAQLSGRKASYEFDHSLEKCRNYIRHTE